MLQGLLRLLLLDGLPPPHHTMQGPAYNVQANPVLQELGHIIWHAGLECPFENCECFNKISCADG